MRFLQEIGFTIKPDKAREFQEWLVTNEQRIKDCYPQGTSFVGIFACVFSSEKGAGDMRYVEQLDSYAALDRLAAAGKDPDSEYGKVMTEFIAFLDPATGAPWSATLLKDLIDATVFDMPSQDVPEREPAGAGR